MEFLHKSIHQSSKVEQKTKTRSDEGALREVMGSNPFADPQLQAGLPGRVRDFGRRTGWRFSRISVPIGNSATMGEEGVLWGRLVRGSVRKAAEPEPTGIAARPTSAAWPSITEVGQVRFIPRELNLERVAERYCGASWRTIRATLKPLQLTQLALWESWEWHVTEAS